MARKSSAAPFKMKYTNGKKTDSTAFFQMANPPAAPNPAVDEAIKKQMDQTITQTVNKAVMPEESSMALQTSPAKEKGKKVMQFLGKLGKAAATSMTHGLDAVYGTGKMKADKMDFKFSDDNKDGDEE